MNVELNGLGASVSQEKNIDGDNRRGERNVEIGKLAIFAGVVLIIFGLTSLGLAKLNLPLGRLPGDLVWRGKNSTVYFPWVTCLLLSLIGTLLMWLLRRR
jgi:H+/Cl- antiporter ClcA